MAEVNEAAAPPIQVRDSSVHGRGVFATRRIEKGERIMEYLGERVSHEEADRRYESKEENDSHTFLFIVDSKTVIDAGVDGNDARFFNHSCDPNCESVVEKRRVYIEAIRAIEPGEEMTYDYQIYKEEGDPENIDEVFACRCGFANCRGTMLWPPEPKKKRARAKDKAAPAERSAAAGGRRRAGKGGSKGKTQGGGRGKGKTQGKGKSQGRGKTQGKGKNQGKGNSTSKGRGKSNRKASKKTGRRR
jgi:uncharacterized protein